MDVQPHFFDVGRVDVAVGITARNHGPGPDIGGHVVKTDLAGHGVSVFVPFEGTEAPEVTAQVEGEISAEFAHRTGGTLTLRRGDGSSDALPRPRPHRLPFGTAFGGSPVERRIGDFAIGGRPFPGRRPRKGGGGRNVPTTNQLLHRHGADSRQLSQHQLS